MTDQFRWRIRSRKKVLLINHYILRSEIIDLIPHAFLKKTNVQMGKPIILVSDFNNEGKDSESLKNLKKDWVQKTQHRRRMSGFYKLSIVRMFMSYLRNHNNWPPSFLKKISWEFQGSIYCCEKLPLLIWLWLSNPRSGSDREMEIHWSTTTLSSPK